MIVLRDAIVVVVFIVFDAAVAFEESFQAADGSMPIRRVGARGEILMDCCC